MINNNKQSWFDKFKTGLKTTTSKFGKQISSIFTAKKLDDEALEDLENILISSDLGTELSINIIDSLKKQKFDGEDIASQVKLHLFNLLSEILKTSEKNINYLTMPQVITMCGVNGNGKTTTTAKLGKIFRDNNLKVLVVACDTFRAAAVEQLKNWCLKLNLDIYTGADNQDPASVVFEAAKVFKEHDYDIMLIDTAGRLQNKSNLMDELAKINRTIDKALPNIHRENLMIIDGTTGQNAIKQVDIFKNYINLTGIVITKLDGTAKGAILIAIFKQFGFPILAIGLGEGENDLINYSHKSFLDAIIYGDELK